MLVTVVSMSIIQWLSVIYSISATEAATSNTHAVTSVMAATSVTMLVILITAANT